MRIGIAFLLVANLFACGSYKNPQQSGTRIELSEGGGFTGAYKTWYLLNNGQVFVKKESDTTFQKVKFISKKTAESYFKQAANLFKYDKKIPATALNYSRSIQYFNHGKSSMVVWSPGDLKYSIFDSFYLELLAVLEKSAPQ